MLKANLRDNMTDLELIFTMLGERVTTEIPKKEKPETFEKTKKWPAAAVLWPGKSEGKQKKS